MTNPKHTLAGFSGPPTFNRVNVSYWQTVNAKAGACVVWPGETESAEVVCTDGEQSALPPDCGTKACASTEYDAVPAAPATYEVPLELNVPSMGLTPGIESVYEAQSVFVGHEDDAWLVAVAVADDCCAKGIVNVTEEACCSAEIVRSATAAVEPVEVAIVPAIEPGPVLVPLVAISGIFPSAEPGATPVVIVVAYSTLAPFTATATTS